MDDKLVKIAADVLNVSCDVAAINCKEIPEHNAFYFWNPVKGGLAVIVGKTGEKLGATSGIGFSAHLQAYIEGRRN